ncbi:FlgO family outer membrane protein [Candidatus Halobeggiatoa sp. HSG11]|nr:FlgO family outer membrane protein [Candidatus Halobeggiatoa sp. HSG11]
MKRILTSFLIVFFIAGCSIFSKDYNLISTSYKATDKLLKGVRDIHQLTPRHDGVYTKQPILVTSFVNVDNVQQSSTFGRVIGEQIGSRLAQRNYKIIEMKMRTSNVFVQERTGELLLSRELREISLQHDAYAVVVGTYGVGKESVYVTAKLVRAKDSVILSSYDYNLPMGPNTKRMLQKKR